jgi:hypothetical protein
VAGRNREDGSDKESETFVSWQLRRKRFGLNGPIRTVDSRWYWEEEHGLLQRGVVE